MGCETCSKPNDMEYECVECKAGMCDDCWRSCDYCEKQLCTKHTVLVNGVDACEGCADKRVD